MASLDLACFAVMLRYRRYRWHRRGSIQALPQWLEISSPKRVSRSLSPSLYVSVFVCVCARARVRMRVGVWVCGGLSGQHVHGETVKQGRWRPYNKVSTEQKANCLRHSTTYFLSLSLSLSLSGLLQGPCTGAGPCISRQRGVFLRVRDSGQTIDEHWPRIIRLTNLDGQVHVRIVLVSRQDHVAMVRWGRYRACVRVCCVGTRTRVLYDFCHSPRESQDLYTSLCLGYACVGACIQWVSIAIQSLHALCRAPHRVHEPCTMHCIESCIHRLYPGCTPESPTCVFVRLFVTAPTRVCTTSHARVL